MAKKNNDGFVYEQGISELEEIVKKLSQGQVSLDESLNLYKRGVELTNLCGNRLNEVEQTIKMINLSNNQEDMFVGNEESEL
ncbi:MAG: exodeoxyribonuclease VII small subunit [Clostridia bacterium]|nr:exodeoxyribonuclease VII small subunit [Clostridia bacterium]